MKRTFLIAAITAALFGLGCMEKAQAQTKKPKTQAPPVAQQIAPDTLADLKAEYEYQLGQALPAIAEYKKAQEARLACAEETIRNPLSTFCERQVRDLQIATSVGMPYIEKAALAKEAYEREQRKADRTK